MNKIHCFLVGIALLTGCSSNKILFKSEIFDDLGSLTLNKVLWREKKLKSTDITPDHKIEIGEGIYPNNKKHELETPRIFKRRDSGLELEVNYYYTKIDNSVKVILYQWSRIDNPNFEPKSKTERQICLFDKKWNKLVEGLTIKLGDPTAQEKESTKPYIKNTTIEQSPDSLTKDYFIDFNEPSTAWRDDAKWINENGLNAYLFMFGDYVGGYRQIRLAVYKQ